MKNKILKILFLTTFLLVSLPTVAQNNTTTTPKATTVKETSFDSGSYELISPIGNLSRIEDRSENGFSDFVNLIIQIALALAGAIAVVVIIINGVQYMTTASSGEKSESKLKISSAIGGLVLLFCSYFLLYTINPDLVKIKIGGMKISEGEWDYTETTDYDLTPVSSAAECSGGLVKIPITVSKKAGVHDNICKELADRLMILKSRAMVDWIITSTTDGNHASQCHKKNTKKSGSCVDIAIRDEKGKPIPANDARWGILCEAVAGIQGLDFLNEASRTPKCESIRKNVQTKYGTGSHLHVIYTGK